MTSSMFVDVLVNPTSNSLKKSDANKNAINNSKENRDNAMKNEYMNEILSFLFR